MEFIDVLKQKFVEEFNPERVIWDLLNLIDEDKLLEYLLEKFKNEFSYEEVYHLFKNCGELNEEDLQILLENMGYDYVNIDELDEEEREKYF